jgi:predicted Zn finger-like uncharacterized protein
MRLVCPNCGAQYEVSDDLIPPSGRDVQCSACNQTWFVGADGQAILPEDDSAAGEPPAGAPPQADLDLSLPADDVPSPDEPVWDDPLPDDGLDAAVPAPATNVAVAPVAAQMPPKEEPDPDPPVIDTALSGIAALMASQSQSQSPATAGAAPVRPALSDSAAAILREEAAREAAARRAESDPLMEGQTELGLEPAAERPQQADEARRRMAALRGQDIEPTTPAARRDLFPDIDAINSTLRPSGEAGSPESMVIYPEDIDHKRGRRAGFTTVLLIFVILALLYLFSDRISAAIPQLEPVLERYVAVVNDARLWLDLQLQALLSADAPPAPDSLPETLPEPLPEQTPAPDVGPAPDQGAAPAPETAPAGN